MESESKNEPINMRRNESKEPESKPQCNQYWRNATWNVCHGITNKKDLITNMIYENKIDIICLQEVEIDQKIFTNMKSIKNYNIEIEPNDVRSQVATYIKSTINYFF